MLLRSDEVDAVDDEEPLEDLIAIGAFGGGYAPVAARASGRRCAGGACPSRTSSRSGECERGRLGGVVVVIRRVRRRRGGLPAGPAAATAEGLGRHQLQEGAMSRHGGRAEVPARRRVYVRAFLRRAPRGGEAWETARLRGGFDGVPRARSTGILADGHVRRGGPPGALPLARAWRKLRATPPSSFCDLPAAGGSGFNRTKGGLGNLTSGWSK